MTHFSSSSDFTFEQLNKLKKDPTVNVKTVSANDMLKDKVYNTLDFSPNANSNMEISPQPKGSVQETASHQTKSNEKPAFTPEKKQPDD